MGAGAESSRLPNRRRSSSWRRSAVSPPPAPTAALLADKLGADALILLTDLPAVAVDAGTRYERLIATVPPAQLRSIPVAAAPTASKVEAACRFVDGSGGPAAIGALADLGDILDGRGGTLVIPAGSLTYHPRRRRSSRA